MFTILPDDINSEISNLEQEITLLEHGHKLSETDWTPVPRAAYAVAYEAYTPQYVYAGEMRGSSVAILLDVVVDAGIVNYTPGLYVGLQWRYYQQAPSIYTQDQRNAGTNFISLASATVNVILGQAYPQQASMTAAVPANARGTYGRFEVWSYTNGLEGLGGEVSIVAVYGTGVIA